MKILLINKFLYPKGGDAIVTLETGKLLSEKGHQVRFWGMQHPQNPNYQYNEYFIPFVDFDAPTRLRSKIRLAARMLYSIPAQERLKEVLTAFKPDIVHLHNIAHQISPSIVDLLKMNRIPCVMTMHDYKLTCASYRLLAHGLICERCKNRRFYHCLLQRCVKDSRAKSLLNTMEMYLHHSVLHCYDDIKRFISPSKFLKTKMQEMGFTGKIDYLPNFIKMEEYIPQFTAGENSIVYFGRLSHEKGLPTLINAVKQIPHIELKLIGDGPLKESLEHRVERGAIHNVEFLGYKSSDELHREIGKSLAVVLPSEWYENNPRSVMESFALGKPVIGAAIGGIPELVKNYGTGFTFQPGNADDLRSKIECAMNHPKEMRQMGINARRVAEEEFNENKHYHELMNIYRKARNHGT